MEVIELVLWRPGPYAELFLHKHPQEDVMKKIRRHNNPVLGKKRNYSRL